MTDTRRRVKLYALNAERQWDDKGTGHVSSNYVEKLKGISLLVRAEADGSLLLESKIQSDTAYQKQQETLIVWSEGDNYDLALSFQEKAGCDEIWEKICQVQGKDPSVDFTQDIVEESEDERCFDEISDSVPAIDLPACEIAKLEEISELVSSCLPSPIRREKLAVAIENEGYIKKLLNLFHMCEDLENVEGLHHLYEIFKNIFLLNKNALFELMFAEDTIFDVVGCLEFDPSLTTPKRHRQYLKSIASFHEVIKINNPELLSKIHQTYRVQYIQEVVLPTPSVFEENMLSTLSSFIFFNKNEIVTQLQEDEKFLTELFNQLTDEDTGEIRRKELVLFLKEFFSFSTTLQPQARESFFKTLSNLGVLQAMEITLAAENKTTKSASTDILRYTVDFSPSMVREYMLQQLSNIEDDTLLMNVIIEQMTCDSDPEMGGAVQLMYIIKDLLDPENMLGAVNKQEKTDFLNYFYKHCMHILIGPLLVNTANDTPEKEDSCSVQLLSLILELLTFCVEHHTYHIKNYILHKDLLRRILVLMKSRHTFLVLSALRFMRKIVALKDEFYNRYIIKGNLFAPVVDALTKNNGRYNMMDSAICEMFEHIRAEDIKSLSTHVVENFGQTVDKVLYVNTFKALRQKYEQQQDRQKDRSQAPLDNVGSILRQGRFRRDPRQVEEEEEMWFNDDEYEDDTPTSAASIAAASSPTMSAAAVAAAAIVSNSPLNTSAEISSPTSTSETPLEAAAAVAASAGASVGFVTATTLAASSSHQSPVTSSTSPLGGGEGAANAVLSMAQLAAGKLSESDKSRIADMNPTVNPIQNNAKKGLVDYDADSDDDDIDDENKTQLAALEAQEAEAAAATLVSSEEASKSDLEAEKEQQQIANNTETPTQTGDEKKDTTAPTEEDNKVEAVVTPMDESEPVSSSVEPASAEAVQTPVQEASSSEEAVSEAAQPASEAVQAASEDDDEDFELMAPKAKRPRTDSD
jgi:protein phosphatase-4 regulatory subunit 3